MRKLKNNKGETIVELLAAILISALAVGLLFSCAVSSININKIAKESDEKFSTLLNKIEQRDNTIQQEEKVNITENETTITININLYGEDELYSYSIIESGG